MARDVVSFIQSCPICQKLSDKSSKSHGSNFTVSVDEPNQRIAIDTIGPLEEDDRGNKYILVFIDCMSRFVDLKPTKTVSAPECAEKLLEYFGNNGPPGESLSDRNKEFLNNLVKEFLKLTGVKSKLSIPYSHQDNAIVERSIKEVRRHLTALRIEMDYEIPWSIQLLLIQHMFEIQRETWEKDACVDTGKLWKSYINSDINIALSKWT
jgi:transposase InsO family protein